ncbi:hypothetical protein ACFPME_02525 [Rhodanobacter umsongensis]|uniref:DUF4123 domain-containing protein n=1 Tax=Rhodanobacter umsongensis TaxID=633153 RepID=A0ABW0JHQ5_9GAMM
MILSDMARLPRFDLAGVLQRVVQRGNNRLLCFLADDPELRFCVAFGNPVRSSPMTSPGIWPLKRLINATLETLPDDPTWDTPARMAGTPGHLAGGTSHVA